MSESCARAVVLALAALYDIAEEAGKGPIPPSLSLRALLALVYEASHKAVRRDRKPFDAYWKTVTDHGREDQPEADRNYTRQFVARANVAAIARTFGMRPDSEIYKQFIGQLRRNQRMATDRDFRARAHIVDRLERSKNIPRGITLDEWEAHLREGWHEKPRR